MAAFNDKERRRVIRLAVDWRSFRHSVRGGDPRDWEAAIRRCAELGAEGVMLAPAALPPPWRSNPRRLNSLAQELRLRYVVSARASLGLASPTMLWRPERADALELAKAVNADILHLPPAALAPLGLRAGGLSILRSKTFRRAAVAWLGRFCAAAAPLGLTVALENGGAVTASALLRLLEKADQPNLRAALAPGGGLQAGDDPYKTTAALAPQAALAILADRQGRGVNSSPTPLGDGRIDLLEVFRLLQRAGVDVLCAVRTEPSSGRPQDEETWLARSFVHLAGLRAALEREAAG